MSVRESPHDRWNVTGTVDDGDVDPFRRTRTDQFGQRGKHPLIPVAAERALKMPSELVVRVHLVLRAGQVVQLDLRESSRRVPPKN